MLLTSCKVHAIEPSAAHCKHLNAMLCQLLDNLQHSSSARVEHNCGQLCAAVLSCCVVKAHKQQCDTPTAAAAADKGLRRHLTSQLAL
jgi:hypothetical protein